MEIIQKTLAYLKSLTAETVSNAKSGHTGSALGASSIMLALFHDHLFFDPKDTKLINRDRLVMSAGHTSALYYSLLHLFGYDISIEDLKKFRQIGSKTPGHPEINATPGVEVSTGPLGQGVANAVGLAIAESMMEAKFNEKKFEMFNNYTYCYAGDGCLMEGVAVEACSLAGTLKLNKLILLYDNNEITIDGKRDLACSENTALKFEAMGWNVIEVKDGNDYYKCSSAIKKAKKSDKPTIIIFKTTIGIGTKCEGSEKSHAMPLSAEDLAEFKTSLGVEGSFYVPDDVYDFCKSALTKNYLESARYKKQYEAYAKAYPEKYLELAMHFKEPKINFNKILKSLNKTQVISGRDMGHEAINLISKDVPNFVGGTADVAPSTKAVLDDYDYYSPSNRLGKNIHFGIREHAMGAISNGIALYTNIFVFDSTFMGFSNYMTPAIRMSAMMHIPVLSIFTHDSINIGEDGPSHQPIEQISALRQIVGLNVFRPTNSAELVAGLKIFFETKTPTALILSKSKLENNKNVSLEDALKGGYIIYKTKEKPMIEIIATGSEIVLATQIAKKLESKSVGVKVISMPCEKLFDAQEKKYKSSVLGGTKLRVVIEASNDTVWYKYLTSKDMLVNVTNYQTSGKGSEVYAHAGFDADLITKNILKKLKLN